MEIIPDTFRPVLSAMRPYGATLSERYSTHWSRNKMAAILGDIFLCIFLCKTCCILIQI